MTNTEKLKLHIIGNSIRTKREALGLSISNLAQAIDVDIYDLAEYEFGVTDIPANKLWILCKVLKTDCNTLLQDLRNIC